MAANLDQIMNAERKIKSDISKANIKVNTLIDQSIDKASNEANLLNVEAEKEVTQLFKDRKKKISEIELELDDVVKKENDKIVSKVLKKKVKIVEEIYEEMIK